MNDQVPSGRGTDGWPGAPCCCAPAPARCAARAARTSGASGAVGPQLDQRRSGGASSSAKPAAAEHHLGTRVLERGSLELGPPGGQQGSRDDRGDRAGAGARRPSPARIGRLEDRLPAGAAAQVGPQCALDVAPRRRRRAAGLQRGQAQHDARGAEPALAGPGGDEGRRPSVPVAPAGRPSSVVTSPAGDPAQRGDAGHAGQPVDPHRAAAALALGAAAVLDRTAAQLLAQRVEQRDAVGDGDLASVQDEGDEGIGAGAAQGTGRPDGRWLS